MSVRISVFFKLNGLPKVLKNLCLKRLRYKQYIKDSKFKKLKKLYIRNRMTTREINIWRKQKHIKPSLRG